MPKQLSKNSDLIFGVIVKHDDDTVFVHDLSLRNVLHGDIAGKFNVQRLIMTCNFKHVMFKQSPQRSTGHVFNF